MFNISFEKLKSFFVDFLTNLSEPLYFILQKPTNEKHTPNTIIKGPFQSELLFYDLPTRTQICDVLDQYGEILLNDGMSQFGVRSLESGDEIFIAKYKIGLIFSDNVQKYSFLLNKYGILKTNNLITAWDTFSPDYPGQCSRVVIDNKDIYKVAEELKEISPRFESKIFDE